MNKPENPEQLVKLLELELEQKRLASQQRNKTQIMIRVFGLLVIILAMALLFIGMMYLQSLEGPSPATPVLEHESAP